MKQAFIIAAIICEVLACLSVGFAGVGLVPLGLALYFAASLV